MFSENETDVIVGKIAEAFAPKAIVIFGSVARGTADENSDLDILVILDTELSYYERTLAVRRAIGVTSIPVDILVFTPEEIESEKDRRGSVVFEALNDGIVAYGKIRVRYEQTVQPERRYQLFLKS